MTDPGTLRDRITIEGEVIINDPDYGPTPGGWGVIASRIAANVQDTLPSRSEAVKQGIAIAANQTRIRFRYRTDIDSSMRVTIHGPKDRVMQIIGGPAVLGNRAGIEILCEDYSTQGGA